MNVLVTGATGLVGSALVPYLAGKGHAIRKLVRKPLRRDAGEFAWDPERGTLDASALEGADGIVHLAGENIAAGRWTPAKKARIRDSRVRGTKLLAEAAARCERPPKVLASASAVGYYGDRGSELLTETSEAGSGFLASVCREWEQAASPAAARGIRTVAMRFGVVLSGKGGVLGKMLPPFRLGLGGKVGSGGQYMSWIAIDDLVAAIAHVLERPELSGAMNTVAPVPVTNLDFTRALGRALGRPTIFPLPAFAARLLFGEMADELLLASARVEPRRLLASGFSFRYREIEPALGHVLGSPR